VAVFDNPEWISTEWISTRGQYGPRVLEFFAQINNLLDHRYYTGAQHYTGAQLGPTGFTSQGTVVTRPLPAVDGACPVVPATFYAPGAPIGAWGGMRIKF
jgi:hypothetical protein